MPAFVCDACHVIENSACGEYWGRQSHNLPILCSLCFKGHWHGRFPRELACDEKVIIGRGRFIESKGEPWVPTVFHYKQAKVKCDIYAMINENGEESLKIITPDHLLNVGEMNHQGLYHITRLDRPLAFTKLGALVLEKIS